MSEQALLAKSRSRHFPVDPPTVESHCKDVHRAAVALWDAVEADLASALQLDIDKLRSELRPLYFIAALLHDIGKANSSFQRLVRGNREKRQPVRHEILSALLVSGESFLGQWLSEALTDKEVWALAWAVGGHHLQMRAQNGTDRENPLLRLAGSDKVITIYLGDSQITSLLDAVKSSLVQQGCSLNGPPVLTDRTFTMEEDRLDSIEPLIRNLVSQSRKAWSLWSRDRQFAVRVAMLKALLVAADVAGSALVAEGLSLTDWTAKTMATRLDTEDLTSVVTERLEGRPPRHFQSRVEESTFPATVVMAGCGNGKTIAAYLWAKRWASRKKLFFAYPTTGTTSAGFEDYLLAQTHLERALLHGRAEVDLQAMAGCPEDDVFEAASRLDSLKAWGQQVVACTVDTVLGLIQNQRRGLFSSPAIISGAFVFDEVHSYDRRLFGELLTFLRVFTGAPVLLMSASIPPARFEALRRVLGDRMGDVIAGEPDLENRLRYQIESRPSPEECWQVVQRSLERNEKVLWVCNTVVDAIKVFRRASEKGFPALIYHSRFRYRDRVDRQREVLDAFKPSAPPCFVVATQVCEMSLDISAALLISALAPLPALVQRMGRLNRFAQEDSPARACVIYPFSGRPYDKPEHKEQIEAAERAIAALANKPCSQSDLAAQLNNMTTNEEWTESSAWLDGGWQSEPLPTREGEYTVTMLREDDLDEISRKLGPESCGRWTAQRLVPWTIPMLLNEAFVFVRRIGGYPVAPRHAIAYDLTEGARWRKKNEK
jgi:CRISPR-associated endonuclease/helicase Cas3